MTELATMLTESQITQFNDEGYVMVPNIFRPCDLNPLRAEIDALVGAATQQLYNDGMISDKHEAEPFETRLTRLFADHPELSGHYVKAVEGKAGGGHTGIEMFRLLTNPGLLDVMGSLLGDEIIASSVYRMRPKVPGFGRGIVPWHQDSGYFAAHCDNDLIVTVWVPLVDATVENGCLEVLPRTHLQGVVRHYGGGPAGYLIIEDGDLPDTPDRAIPVPVPLGGALLMTNTTPHHSTPNYTDVIRWSVDLRYQSNTVPTNAFQEPSDFDPAADTSNIACYAPEGDFVVRSKAHPETVHSYEQYASRRHRYDEAGLPYPDRKWQSLAGRA